MMIAGLFYLSSSAELSQPLAMRDKRNNPTKYYSLTHFTLAVVVVVVVVVIVYRYFSTATAHLPSVIFPQHKLVLYQ